ncbi:hypothetical protein QJS83_03175 [Bdellovibrio sp. 22V]|uniref:hypothetical protein n=1 Tax=Bdellovibrio TaxID=958 RepID=UPI0025428E3A|nr:hypothetical protein [Bdellovibrio sp. 22V]WII72871.1 hypothetical protein QJS83_03175 [Bdellovibrio sp. 22V]
MRVFLPLLFLTLVVGLNAVHAAPQTTTTLETTPFLGEDDPELSTVDVSQLPPRPTFLLNVSAGYSGGNYLEDDEYHQGVLLAIRYLPLTRRRPTWDYQVDVSESKAVGLSLGYRWYSFDEDYYIPYLRLAGATYLDGAGELAGLVNLARWRVHASAGLGDTFTAEFGVGYAMNGPDLFALLGYNFSF